MLKCFSLLLLLLCEGRLRVAAQSQCIVESSRLIKIITAEFDNILDPSSCSSSEYNQIRLYNIQTSNVTEEGSVQLCHSGTWYALCDYSWDCREGNAACKQLGYDGASKCYSL